MFVLLLYALLGCVAYRRLMPRLLPAAKHLALAMLAAQVIAIVVPLEYPFTSDYQESLWSLHGMWWHWHGGEWNIPAMLASTQLALIGGVALLTSRIDRARPSWQRVYLVGIGLVFLFLAFDEYMTLHEAISNWGIYYGALGVGIVLATVIVAWLSPRRLWIWKICLAAGLFVAAIGAMVFDILWIPCDASSGIFRIQGCLETAFLEESFEFLGIWLVLAALLGLYSDAALRQENRETRVLFILPPLWILLLLVNAFLPRLELPLLARPAAVEFESGVRLRGLRLQGPAGGEFVVDLYVSARQGEYLALGYGVQFVDQVSGEIVARTDEWANRQHGVWFMGSEYAPIYRQRLAIDIPTETPTNRALWIVLTHWRKIRASGEFVPQRVFSSDLQLLGDTHVVIGEYVVPSEQADGWTYPPLALFDIGFALKSAQRNLEGQAGEILSINFEWHADAPYEEDLIQFLHLGHEESGEWLIYDQQPLGARLPTRLWYTGLTESELWQVPLPSDLAPGKYALYTGLYYMRDNERVVARTAEGNSYPDARVPLGYLEVHRLG